MPDNLRLSGILNYFLRNNIIIIIISSILFRRQSIIGVGSANLRPLKLGTDLGRTPWFLKTISISTLSIFRYILRYAVRTILRCIVRYTFKYIVRSTLLIYIIYRYTMNRHIISIFLNLYTLI